MSQKARWEALVVVVILLISLGLRLTSLDRFIVCDEVRWTCRSVNFQQALLRRDWKNTYRTGHPGVVTTWLGSLFITDDNPQMRTMCEETLDGRKVVWAGETRAERTQLMHQLGDLLFQGRVGVALFSWVCIVTIYFLTREIWGSKVAVLSLILTALDPFYLALSRFLHVDAVLTSLMTISVLGLVASVQRSISDRRQIVFLVASGVATGLAILQKSPAMFLGPFAALVLGLNVVRKGLSRETLLTAARNLLIWGVVSIAVYVAMWPTMWVSPVDAVTQVLDKALGYAVEGHGSGNYFMGRPDEDPGWLFYPVSTAFRLTPLALIGLVTGLGWAATNRKDAEGRFGVVVLLAYAASFWAFMSLGDKMFDRYFLPVYPALEIVAGAGLWWAVDAIHSRFKRAGSVLRSPFLVYGFALVVQIAITLPHYPHYLTYYNPLLGGTKQAEKILLLGWGEGCEQVAAHLNAKPDAEELQVAMSAFPSFAPQFNGDTRSIENYSIWETDYVMFYISHVQRLHNPELLSEYLFDPDVEPEQIVTLHGVDYVWLYRNEHYLEPMAYIEAQSDSSQQACILVNGDSLFAKHYEGDLPLVTFHPRWDRREECYIYPLAEEVARLVDAQTPPCEQIWYVRYPETERSMYLDLLETRGILEQSTEFEGVDVAQYTMVSDQLERRLVDLRFGDLRLLSYGITDPPPTWGQDGGLTLEWEASGAIGKDYSVFLHLYDKQGHRIAQQDALIRDDEARPTSKWEPDQTGVGLYHLPVAAGTPPGEYELRIGVYLWKTGERLPATGGEEPILPVQVGVPEQPPHVTALRIPHWVEQQVTSQLRLLGHDIGAEYVIAGDTLYLRLFWEATAAMDEAYGLQLALRGHDGERYGATQFELVNTDYPTTRWRKGQLLQERYYLAVDERVPTGEATVELNLVDEEGKLVLSDPIAVAQTWVQSPKPSFDMPMGTYTRSGAVIGEAVRLLGYELEPAAKVGGTIQVTLHWQAEKEMEESYKAFVHLYDESGAIVAQQDRLPGWGARPTQSWERDEVIADRYRLSIGREIPEGDYRVGVGLYNAQTGKRIPALSVGGERLEQDRILVGRVEIER